MPENDQVREFREVKDYVYSDAAIISKLDTNPSLYLYYVSIGSAPTDEHFNGTRKLLEKELSQVTCFFENISVRAVGGKELIKACRELENKFEVQINIVDIFPLIVPGEVIKKAYSFTCVASEFMKLLGKEDGSLRRSLFNDNVRDYLGKTAVNIEIEQTIQQNPDMFLLCNNGITVVCSDFNQVRDKLVKIENPQIVNGCQTSISVFNLKEHPNAKKIQLLVRVISTDDLEITNKIVRGTNKQNQVLDEAFEATLPFHQETLEPFFLAFDKPIKIYYERRSKQYNNDPLIKKTQIVNLRILTQTFVAMFLDAPHESHIHEAKLLEKYGGGKETRMIFREDHSPYPYYVSALTSYMFDKYFRENWAIGQRYRTYKAQLYSIFKYGLGEIPPKLGKSKALELYCDKLVQLLTEPRFGTQVRATLKAFDDTLAEWLKRGKSKFAIKDTKDFSDLLIERSRGHLVVPVATSADEDRDSYDGTILNIVWRSDPTRGAWFGFIGRGTDRQNLYFDNRGYSGDPKELIPHTKVRYEIGYGPAGDFAVNVQLTK